MNTFISVLYIVISISYTLCERNRKSITSRNALAAELALEQAEKTSSTLTTAYANNELQSAEDVALSFVDSVPILGNLVYLFTEDPDPTYDVESGLNTINNNLKLLHENIEWIGTKVDELSRTIDLSVIQNQVATDKREISNCFTDFLLYLQNPSANAEQDRLKHCYNKFSYVRQIGDILMNKQMTFMQQPIFDQIIGKSGYCDGEGIQDVYGFLLGLYIEGCSALITSEVLTYGNESTTYKDECKVTLQNANATLNEIFNTCKTESCNNFIQVMANILKVEQVSSIKTQLQTSFPWFYFVVVTLQKSISSGFTLQSNHVFNYLILSSDVVSYRMLVWSPNTNTDSQNNTYGIKYKENEVSFMFNGLNLLKETQNGTTRLMGFLDDIDTSETYCNDDINIDDQTDNEGGNSFEDLVTSDHTISFSLPGYAIGLIVLGLVGLALIMCCICCKLWKKNNKTAST